MWVEIPQYQRVFEEPEFSYEGLGRHALDVAKRRVRERMFDIGDAPSLIRHPTLWRR